LLVVSSAIPSRELVLVDDLYPCPFRYAGHFGIRITDADKDKLVDGLDVDDRHLNNIGHVHGGALAAFADDLGGSLAGLNAPPGVSDHHDRVEDRYLSGLRAGAAYRRCHTGACGAAHDRPANLDIPR
jgi:uncharacterized protein (TIGR00369 family)